MNKSIYIRRLLMICLICGMVWGFNGVLLRESAQAYTGPLLVDSGLPNQRPTLDFQVERRPEGVWLAWQVATDNGWLGFTVYSSMDCQWENAVLITAPIFSSTHQEDKDKAEVIHYSLLDDSAVATQMCSYWVVGTAVDGTDHTFGPTALVPHSFGVYLPVVHR